MRRTPLALAAAAVCALVLPAHAAPAAQRVTRRYRFEPDTLVRDAVRNYRTGRLDRVLAGEFDLY